MRQPGAAWSRCSRFSWSFRTPEGTRPNPETLPIVSRLASFRNSRSRDTRTSLLDDDECAGDPIAKFCSDIDESLTEGASHSCWESNQDKLQPSRVHPRTRADRSPCLQS